jgi:DNA invertase Pin-like site-specific DNA recombinase
MAVTVLGYARVSTKKQSTDGQVDALVRAGVDPQHIYSDVLSGARDDRPGLAALLAYARAGDEIVVVALDRLGRSLSHMVTTIATLSQRGIKLRSLREGVDYSTPAGQMLAGIFSSLAQYERLLIKERAQAAREAAAARGRHVGRPRALTDEQVRTARTLRAAGTDITSIAAALNTSRATVYRATDNL